MKAKTTYYINRSIMGLAFNMMFTATALYRIDIAKLEIYQLILIGTAMELSIFLFEMPTGIVADLKSRKISVITGIFIIGFATVFEALTPYFFMIFIAQVLWGFGYTFISGALQSWASDETHKKDLSHMLLTGSQLYTLMSIIGIVITAMIGTKDIKIALYVASIMMVVLGLTNIFFMKEENFHKEPHDHHLFKAYMNQFKKGYQHIKSNQVLKIMFVVMLFFGLYSEGIDRTYEIHILDHLDFRTLIDLPAIWILSIINAFIVLLGFILMQLIKKYVAKHKQIFGWLITFTMTMIIGVLCFGFLPNAYLAVLGFLIFHAAREASSPLLDTILLSYTPSNIKATVLSTFGQIDAIGQIISGLIMVAIGLTLDIKFIYLVTALILVVPVISLIQLRFKKVKL